MFHFIMSIFGYLGAGIFVAIIFSDLISKPENHIKKILYGIIIISIVLCWPIWIIGLLLGTLINMIK